MAMFWAAGKMMLSLCSVSNAPSRFIKENYLD